MANKTNASEKTKTYLIVDLDNGKTTYMEKEPSGGWSDEYKTKKMVFRWIEPGSFVMGSPMDEAGRWNNETPHKVEITKGYYIGVFPVTYAQYNLVIENFKPIVKQKFVDIQDKYQKGKPLAEKEFAKKSKETPRPGDILDTFERTLSDEGKKWFQMFRQAANNGVGFEKDKDFEDMLLIRGNFKKNKAYKKRIDEEPSNYFSTYMGDIPSFKKTKTMPVAYLPYRYIFKELTQEIFDYAEKYVIGFLNEIGEEIKEKNLKFALPTEAQWEFACRAGTKTAWNNGKSNDFGENDKDIWLDKLGRYAFNGGLEKIDGEYKGVSEVGSYLPNAWGIYDMHGNVCEWCNDFYDECYGIDLHKVDLNSYLAKDPELDETKDADKRHVLRGGSWKDNASDCRASRRIFGYETRLAPYEVMSGKNEQRIRNDAVYDAGFRLIVTL